MSVGTGRILDWTRLARQVLVDHVGGRRVASGQIVEHRDVRVRGVDQLLIEGTAA